MNLHVCYQVGQEISRDSMVLRLRMTCNVHAKRFRDPFKSVLKLSSKIMLVSFYYVKETKSHVYKLHLVQILDQEDYLPYTTLLRRIEEDEVTKFVLPMRQCFTHVE